MNPRIIGIILAVVGFAVSFFFISSSDSTWAAILSGVLVGAGVIQSIFGFGSFGEAMAASDRKQSGWIRSLSVWAAGLIPGIGMMIWGSDRARAYELQDLTQNGVVATATITDGYESRRRRGGTSYNLKVKYTDQAGAEHEVEESVSSEEYSNAAIGMPVEVIYSSKNPEVVEILFDEGDKAKYGK